MAISGPHTSGGGGVFDSINITPLTDIFLVLLIIFMVTTSVTIESAAHVDLPNATNTAPENKGVIVTYTTQHELFVNSKDVPERELKSSLAEALGKAPEDRGVPGRSQSVAWRHGEDFEHREGRRRLADRNRGQAGNGLASEQFLGCGWRTVIGSRHDRGQETTARRGVCPWQ